MELERAISPFREKEEILTELERLTGLNLKD